MGGGIGGQAAIMQRVRPLPLHADPRAAGALQARCRVGGWLAGGRRVEVRSVEDLARWRTGRVYTHGAACPCGTPTYSVYWRLRECDWIAWTVTEA